VKKRDSLRGAGRWSEGGRGGDVFSTKKRKKKGKNIRDRTRKKGKTYNPPGRPRTRCQPRWEERRTHVLKSKREKERFEKKKKNLSKVH